MIKTDARTILVLADCHIHAGGAAPWTQAALMAFHGADLFVTLGDMGERAALDALAQIAPVLGVRGLDDEDDPRTAAQALLLEAHGVAIACVFDPAAAGLTTAKDPPLRLSASALAAAFGVRPDVLLWASTHRSSIDRAEGILQVNPGSFTYPDNEAPSFARLTFGDGGCEAEIVRQGAAPTTPAQTA
jgi:putative phosphoesterase